MKKLFIGAALIMVAITIASLSMAADRTRPQKSLDVFVHTHESIVIPETGAVIMWDEQGGMPFYTWSLLSVEEYCSEGPVLLGCIPPDPCKLEYWLRCSRFTRDPDGAGTEPPWDSEEQKACFDYEEEAVFFQSAASIVYNTPGSVVGYEKLVVNANMGDEVQVRGTGHLMRLDEPIATRFRVTKINPNGARFPILETDWRPLKIRDDGVFSDEIEYAFGQLSRDRISTGYYRFAFHVKLANGMVKKAFTRVVVHQPLAN